MRTLPDGSLFSVVPFESVRGNRSLGVVLRLCAPLAAVAFGCALAAQTPNQITQPLDTSQAQVLAHHLPQWASAANDAGPVAADLKLEQMTIVLSRSPAQEAAFTQFLADQQNPASPDYHHWLTPEEVGQRFGLSDADMATVTGWLTSQGLHVNWIAPSRIFIGFGGTAADVGHAFQAELHTYKINGEQRISVSTDPKIPAALAPVIKAVRGLSTITEHPFHQSATQLASPDMTVNGSHYQSPADFATIYDLPASLTGAGETIGIVGWSRTNFADFANFRLRTGATFSNPTEVIPTAYHGTDPGPAYTTTQSGTVAGAQGEATLDVLRTGSTAPGATLLLVVSQPTSISNDGIGADAQYLIQTSPVPAQVMTISFGDCELNEGSSGVTFWDSLFQQAAGEGISVFVSSGDSGASGCDLAFQAPPASPMAISPNYICSSSYATCVGGTEFADVSNASTYWSSSNNSTTLQSALSYIPEGGWNESTTSSVAGSGGGVSIYVPTPTWQTGTGVPTARTGRYTPDVAFSASGHDGYFACFAAGGGSCVASGGSYSFEIFSGTSAAAPSMAGITALLDQKMGAAQGNLNPKLYSLAASAPLAFHDVTVASSGVSGCSVNTASMCNNSNTSQAGYLVGAGYDEVTGLGSLDVQTFINDFNGSLITPTVTVTPNPSSITTAQALSVTVAVNGGGSNPTPTGTVTLASGTYTSAATALSGGSATISVPAWTLAAGTDTLAASYIPDSSSSSTYGAASGSNTVSVTAAPKTTPTVTVTPHPGSITNAQALSVSVTVAGQSGYPTATGSVTLTIGSYVSPATTLASGSATISVPAFSLAAGTDTISAAYTPDSSSSSVYNSATGSNTVSVTAVPKVTPSVTLNLTNGTIFDETQTIYVGATLFGGVGYPNPTGTATLTSGSYNSGAKTLTSSINVVNFTIPAGSLPVGTDTLTVSYIPDSASSSIYNNTSGTSAVIESKAVPNVIVTPSKSNITPAQPLSVSVQVYGGAGSTTGTGSVVLSSGSYSSASTALVSGVATINIPAGALATATDTLTAAYTPDATSSPLFTPGSGSNTVTVGKLPSSVTVTPSPSTITIAQGVAVTIAVGGGSGNPTPTGSVILTSGSYTSAATTLASGGATINVPAGSLAAGTDTLAVNYTPDAASSSTYNSGSGSNTVTVTKLTPAVTVTPSSSSITTVQALSVLVNVSGGGSNPTPTGTVQLTGGGYTSAATSLVGGSATINVPAAALATFTDNLTVTYTPDTPSSSTYVSASGSSTVVVAKATPTVSLTLTPSSITSNQPLGVSVTVSGGAGNPTPTGSVFLSSGTYQSALANLVSGTATFNIPIGTLAIGSDTINALYSIDSASSPIYNNASGSSAVTVSLPPTATFTITGPAVTIATPGATTGNTSTITVTPFNGFTGPVTLTATVTSYPVSAQYLPTLSFGSTTPVSITSTSAGTATLTISTTAATTAALAHPDRSGLPWYLEGGAALACILLFGIPARRRRWRNLLGMILLLAALAGSVIACSSVSNSGGGGGGIAGTTPGLYTITVTGTSGSTPVSGTPVINLTVQ